MEGRKDRRSKGVGLLLLPRVGWWKGGVGEGEGKEQETGWSKGVGLLAVAVLVLLCCISHKEYWLLKSSNGTYIHMHSIFCYIQGNPFLPPPPPPQFK